MKQSLHFEDIVVEYGNMIHHVIHRLGIQDRSGEFFQEGLLALWKVCDTYEEERGALSSYVYYMIRNQLISKIRTTNRKQKLEDELVGSFQEEAVCELEVPRLDPKLYEEIESSLTTNQMKWFVGAVIEDLTLKGVAEKEGVSLAAVKNWKRLAQHKLRKNPMVLEYLTD
ncbi:RNA polymerase sigma factor [Pontibacillus salicampi]|uniref:RNA polymerase sigma factor n=1 Tax=Pontibacillus salicampi TaxID=1449801 RepID=A0ABV6LSD6_9BACI